MLAFSNQILPSITIEFVCAGTKIPNEYGTGVYRVSLLELYFSFPEIMQASSDGECQQDDTNSSEKQTRSSVWENYIDRCVIWVLCRGIIIEHDKSVIGYAEKRAPTFRFTSLCCDRQENVRTTDSSTSPSVCSFTPFVITNSTCVPQTLLFHRIYIHSRFLITTGRVYVFQSKYICSIVLNRSPSIVCTCYKQFWFA
jgi:hypothetical protein